jgi:hypothetical protein
MPVAGLESKPFRRLNSLQTYAGLAALLGIAGVIVGRAKESPADMSKQDARVEDRFGARYMSCCCKKSMTWPKGSLQVLTINWPAMR